MGARTPLRAPARRGAFVAACAAVLAFAFAASASAAELGIDMQVQEQDEWCWAASGDTIAAYLGHGTDQNPFCDLAIGQDTAYQCPNQAGQLSWDQNAFQALGISPGVESGAADFSRIATDIDAGHPLETGISWTAGGGHAEVIYGYDAASQTITFGDPWPDDPRANQMDYYSYVSNDQFTLDDTLSQIGA